MPGAVFVLWRKGRSARNTLDRIETAVTDQEHVSRHAQFFSPTVDERLSPKQIANQTVGVKAQLDAGVRCLSLDIFLVREKLDNPDFPLPWSSKCTPTGTSI
jgi:hypothetical protein